MRNVNELMGKTVIKIDKSSDVLIFHCETGEVYKMYHSQDCCEHVSIDDICGELDDLIGTPILLAEEVSNDSFVKAFEGKFNKTDEWGRNC